MRYSPAVTTAKLYNLHMPKVGIDGGPLSSNDSQRGIGFYVRELTQKLRSVKIIDPAKVNYRDFDVIHLTSFNPFRISVPLGKPAKTKIILTIYDLIPLIYPNNYKPGIRGAAKWTINKFLIKNYVDAVITISETSKKDICRFTGINPNKVFVTYLAPREICKKISTSLQGKVKEKYKLPQKFALYVGDINFNKNIINLVKGCNLSGVPLVIAGKQAAELETLLKNLPHGPKDITRLIFNNPHPQLGHLQELSDLFVKNKVIRLGFVDDADLVKIYNLATVYIQASFYEGFGLPLLEAYACGTPIAVSKNQCHVEILGPSFQYFDPNNIKDIADNIKHPNINKKLPRMYSWDKTAQATNKVYEQV